MVRKSPLGTWAMDARDVDDVADEGQRRARVSGRHVCKRNGVMEGLGLANGPDCEDTR